jgi:serine/threonine protein kinase
MAPEQASADPQMDGRVDIYALGCMLYEMLGGQAPHARAHRAPLVHQLLVGALALG